MKTTSNPKALSMLLFSAIVLALGSVSLYYFYQDEVVPQLEEPQTEAKEDVVLSNQQIIEVVSDRTIKLIKTEDFIALSDYVHPTKGVRFSPYTFVDVEYDVVLTNNEIKNILADSRSFAWGSYDGSGEPIGKSFMAYFEEFVYDEDFISAPEVSYNEPLGVGNTVDNASEVYPDSIITEYYFDGFDPEYEGMDWASLRLVFEEYESEWYLVGIIHNSWTI